MASMGTLQLAVTNIPLYNYATIVVLTAVGYDYILTLPKEVEYIWNKPWTRVSTLFVLVRYFGICSVIIFALVGSSFLPGPEKTYVTHAARYSNILAVFGTWSGWIFISAADLSMLLRVWALYNRSRIILGILLTFYAAETISYLVCCVIFTTQPIVSTAQEGGFSFCVMQRTLSSWPEAIDALQLALGAVMCLLVISRFIREAFQIFKVTRHFRLNRYMNLLAREGTFYFLAILSYALLNLLQYSTGVPSDRWWILTMLPQFIPTFIIVPRFILSLRALYARDLQGRRGSDIDTAFGLTSASGCGAAASGIMFADGVQNEGLELDEEIPIEEEKSIALADSECGV